MLSMLILFGLILMSWLRVVRPGGGQPAGRVIHDARLPLLARLRMHAASGALAILGSMALTVAWDLPWWGPIVAALSSVVLVALPVRYRLTTLGIRSGWTPFRRWTEFAGVSRAPGGARLQGVPGARDLRIWLSGSRGDDEFVALLRRMIRGAYKGQNVLLEFEPSTPSESTGPTSPPVDVTRTAV